MPEPCPRCGGLHTGDCPPESPAAAPANAAGSACAFCGENHPPSVSCAQWAQQQGPGAAALFDPAAYATRPAPVILPRKPRRSRTPGKLSEALVLRTVVAVLALIGVVALARVIAGHFIGGANGTSAALPACSVDRIRANLTTAATIESEAGAALTARVAATNGLLLGPSADCSQQLYLLYTAYIDNAALCLSLASPQSCQARDSAHAQLNQALESEQ